MKKQVHFNLKRNSLIGAIGGGLVVGLSAISSAALANATNPCPSIYYSEPYDSKLIVPAGCRANTMTRQAGFTIAPLTAPTPLSNGSVRIPVPFPEERAHAIAAVTPRDGAVAVKLTNDTHAPITYQALSYTQRRLLAPGEEVVLNGLPTPVTITLVRQDNGFLEVIPVATSEPGRLEISLDEETTFDNQQGVLRIQNDGQVFLN